MEELHLFEVGLTFDLFPNLKEEGKLKTRRRTAAVGVGVRVEEREVRTGLNFFSFF